MHVAVIVVLDLAVALRVPALVVFGGVAVLLLGRVDAKACRYPAQVSQAQNSAIKGALQHGMPTSGWEGKG